MKKIGIVTINDNNNYGNRLQNYALQEILKSLSLDAITIKNITIRPLSLRLSNTKAMTASQVISKIYSKFLKKNHIEQLNGKENKRQQNFTDFTNNYMKESEFTISSKSVPNNIQEKFSFFIAGSDQGWNPNYRYGSSIDFLTFAPSEKRISYAASFGISQIPEKYVGDYSQWLSEISYISVREQAGAKIVKDLIGREASVLADPTLLLSKEKWLTVSKKANNRPDKPYLLTYFLGGPSEETRKKLEKIAKNKNMTLINLGDITETETFEAGPSEFLDYINNASAFFTDSFHGVVFSIIFKTPFIVYKRISSGPSMYSRIETILDNFDMKNREANGFNEDIFSMDFSCTHEVLKREYERSIKYLKNALGIEE